MCVGGEGGQKREQEGEKTKGFQGKDVWKNLEEVSPVQKKKNAGLIAEGEWGRGWFTVS